jgi:hypothetical protein
VTVLIFVDGTTKSLRTLERYRKKISSRVTCGKLGRRSVVDGRSKWVKRLHLLFSPRVLRAKV